MKTIIAGSRNINDNKTVQDAMNIADLPPHSIHITEIVSGCARGVDQIGEQLAKFYGIPIKRFPAQWERFGRSAGYKRNAKMAKYADALIAIWDGKSRGTKHMINLATASGLKVYVHQYHHTDRR